MITAQDVHAAYIKYLAKKKITEAAQIQENAAQREWQRLDTEFLRESIRKEYGIAIGNK